MGYNFFLLPESVLRFHVVVLVVVVVVVVMVVVVVAFSSLARILGECSTIHSPLALFFFSFFKLDFSSCTLIPLFMPGSVHSGSVTWDDCGRIFPDKLRASSFPDRFPRYAWTAA